MLKIFNKSCFKLYAIPAQEFWSEYKKTKFKYHDEQGDFGYKDYTYIVFQQKNREYCVLICSYARIISLRRREKLAEVLHRENIDIQDILHNGNVVIARERE